jgi:hypothetical protein
MEERHALFDILLSGFVAVEKHRYQALHAHDVSWCRSRRVTLTSNLPFAAGFRAGLEL